MTLYVQCTYRVSTLYIQMDITFFPFYPIHLVSMFDNVWGWNCFRGPLPGPEQTYILR